MEVPKELEITPEQRKPGLKNPLTQEQVARFQTGWGAFCPPNEEEIQEIAEELLPQGAEVAEIMNRLADLA